MKKEEHVRPSEGAKVKGVAEEPHPLDRRSGTGRGKELRKEGGGRHNWGTYKDDFKLNNNKNHNC